MSLTVFMLIALLKTPGEGGTVMIQYPTLAECEVAGDALELQFESIDLYNPEGDLVKLKPKVIHTCFEAPAQ